MSALTCILLAKLGVVLTVLHGRLSQRNTAYSAVGVYILTRGLQNQHTQFNKLSTFEKMADKQQPSLTSLAESISQSAKALAATLEQGGHAAPSFALDGLVDYPKSPEVMGLRMVLLDAINDIHRLTLGPTDSSFMTPFFVRLPIGFNMTRLTSTAQLRFGHHGYSQRF